jgi:hypothetical protein
MGTNVIEIVVITWSCWVLIEGFKNVREERAAESLGVWVEKPW